MTPGSSRWPTLDFGGRTVELRAALPPTQQINGRFWAIVDVVAGSSGVREIILDVPLGHGAHCRLPLGCVVLEEGLGGALSSGGTSLQISDSGPQVAICMATHEPEPDLFAMQVQSLRAQTCGDWHAVISDDGSEHSTKAMIAAVLDGDKRFTVLWNDDRVGSYRNFERALAAVPSDARTIAFCDQDDRWHPEKLDAMLSLMPANGLVVCDARIVGVDGHVRSETFWTPRRHVPADLRSISVANSVPGCMSLWDASLQSVVLPFPPGMYTLHHDGWVAAVAAATGGIRRLDQPLIDHLQHGANTLGHLAAVSRRIGRLGRRDPPLSLIRAHRRRLVAQEIDAALRPEALARSIGLRSTLAEKVRHRELDWVSRDDDGLERIAEHILRGLGAEFRGGLPGTDYSVARGLTAARLYRSRIPGH